MGRLPFTLVTAVAELRGANAPGAGLGEGGNDTCPALAHPPLALSQGAKLLLEAASSVEATSLSDLAWL